MTGGELWLPLSSSSRMAVSPQKSRRQDRYAVLACQPLNSMSNSRPPSGPTKRMRYQTAAYPLGTVQPWVQGHMLRPIFIRPASDDVATCQKEVVLQWLQRITSAVFGLHLLFGACRVVGPRMADVQPFVMLLPCERLVRQR